MTTETSVSDVAQDTPAATVNARDRLALLVLITASFTLAVDFSILNVALPRIGA